jgi:curved DNA-binding protein CbpA
MPVHRTHYQNLKVAQDAPDAVIRAAYRTLAHQFHPDRNGGSLEAEGIMAIINASYEVLSAPTLRRRHDEWIARAQLGQDTLNAEANEHTRPNSSDPVGHATPRSRLASFLLRSAEIIIGTVVWIISVLGLRGTFSAIVILMLGIFAFGVKHNPPSAGPYSAAAPSASDSESFQSEPAAPVGDDLFADLIPDRSATNSSRSGWLFAPDGSAWPTNSAYLRGARLGHTGGLSNVIVDNSQNSSAVHLKLVAIDEPTAFPVRECFIPAYGRFTLRLIHRGRYDIRYRDLSTGTLSRSEAFTLVERPTARGTQYSSLSMTLYKVSNGNMQSYGLSEAEF